MEQRQGTGSELQQAELAAGGLREPAESYACALLVRTSHLSPEATAPTENH
jgi:hypothetical protein